MISGCFASKISGRMLDLACQLQMQCSSTTMNCHIALRYVTSHIFFEEISHIALRYVTSSISDHELMIPESCTSTYIEGSRAAHGCPAGPR